jgi:hypothetical protein
VELYLDRAGEVNAAGVRHVRQPAAARLLPELRAGPVAFLGEQRAHPPAQARQQRARQERRLINAQEHPGMLHGKRHLGLQGHDGLVAFRHLHVRPL